MPPTWSSVSACCSMLMTPSAVMTTHTMQYFPNQNQKKKICCQAATGRKKLNYQAWVSQINCSPTHFYLSRRAGWLPWLKAEGQNCEKKIQSQMQVLTSWYFANDGFTSSYPSIFLSLHSSFFFPAAIFEKRNLSHDSETLTNIWSCQLWLVWSSGAANLAVVSLDLLFLQTPPQ